MPKLREQRFYPLPHAAVKFSLFWHFPSRDQQQFALLSQILGQFHPVVAQVCKHYSALNCFCQYGGRASVIDISRCQHRINDTAIDVAQRVQFEAKEPASAAFTKVSTSIAQQPHPSVSNNFADRNRLGINQVESAIAKEACRLKQTTYERAEFMQTSDPLLIRADQRESGSEVFGNNSIGLLERVYPDIALHQSDSDDFRISKSGVRVRRASPVSKPGTSFKEVINKAVDLSHLIYNSSQVGRPPAVEMSLQLHSIHLRNHGDPSFQLNTQV